MLGLNQAPHNAGASLHSSMKFPKEGKPYSSVRISTVSPISAKSRNGAQAAMKGG